MHPVLDPNNYKDKNKLLLKEYKSKDAVKK